MGTPAKCPTMEVSKRDILVSVAALVIFLVVLVPSLVLVNDGQADTTVEVTIGQEISSTFTSDNSKEISTEENGSPTGHITSTAKRHTSTTKENESPSVDNESKKKNTTEGPEGVTKKDNDRDIQVKGKRTSVAPDDKLHRSDLPTDDSAAGTTMFDIRNPKVVQVSNFKLGISSLGVETTHERVQRILSNVPLIDGHNDFPLSIRNHLDNDVGMLHFGCDLSRLEPWASDSMSHTDLLRLRKGRVGGQFWSAYMDCDAQYKDAVQLFLEQIDVIKRLVEYYPDDLQWADSADSIEAAFKSGKIASLVGVESGHAIGSSLAVLRTIYDSGARYMTLTHSCNTPWADAAQAESGDFPADSEGISEFGEKVVLEMNRLGMMVDLAHVSSDTMRDVLRISRAPVIFSHSSARAVANNVRNVPDDVLETIKEKGGIVMVNFYSCYVIEDCDKNNATVDDIVKHINHIRKVAGINHIGIGGDYNGVSSFPIGLEDVSGYPKVFEALINDKTFNWTDEDLEKLAGRNILGVFRAVEKVRDNLAQNMADTTWIDLEDFNGQTGCKSGL